MPVVTFPQEASLQPNPTGTPRSRPSVVQPVVKPPPVPAYNPVLSETTSSSYTTPSVASKPRPNPPRRPPPPRPATKPSQIKKVGLTELLLSVVCLNYLYFSVWPEDTTTDCVCLCCFVFFVFMFLSRTTRLEKALKYHQPCCRKESPIWLPLLEISGNKMSDILNKILLISALKESRNSSPVLFFRKQIETSGKSWGFVMLIERMALFFYAHDSLKQHTGTTCNLIGMFTSSAVSVETAYVQHHVCLTHLKPEV